MAQRKVQIPPEDRIARAALHEFSRLGFDGASTRTIAAKANVNQGLLTYYFGTKLELWKAVVDRLFRTLSERSGAQVQALANVDPVTRLRLAIRHFVEFSAEHPELHRLMLQEGGCDGPRTRALLNTYIQPLYTFICGLVEAAAGTGVPITAIPPYHAFTLLVGAAPHPFATASETRYLLKQDPFAKEWIDAWARSIETLFVGPPPTEGEP